MKDQGFKARKGETEEQKKRREEANAIIALQRAMDYAPETEFDEDD